MLISLLIKENSVCTMIAHTRIKNNLPATGTFQLARDVSVFIPCLRDKSRGQRDCAGLFEKTG